MRQIMLQDRRQVILKFTADLGARLRWPRDTLVNYETGRRRLTVETLTQIAQALNIPPAALLLEDPTFAAIVTQLAREPEAIEDVHFFLNSCGDEPPPHEISFQQSLGTSRD